MLPLLFALSFFAAGAGCGAEFSGNYVVQGEDGRVYVSIIQTQCERVAITWESSLVPNRVPARHQLVLDGQFHSDTGWFGGAPGQSAASLTGTTLEIKMEPRDGLRLTLLPDGDLCVNNGEFLASRQLLQNRSSEDDAASRSERGCSVK